jgi:hypothetical protein
MHTYAQVDINIPGEVQKINAALAVALCNAWLAMAGRLGDTVSEVTPQVYTYIHAYIHTYMLAMAGRLGDSF